MKADIFTTTLNQWRSLGRWMVAAFVLPLLAMAATVPAQSLAYSNAIVNLHPVGYWPMHEQAAAAPGDTETNYGTLGALGMGYCADWSDNGGAPGSTSIESQIAGALTNDADGMVSMLHPSASDSHMVVPRTSPLTTLQSPFTIALWVKSAACIFGDMVSKCGTALNGGNANNKYGIQLSWGSKIQTYVSVGQGTATTAPTTNQRHYIVLICDSFKNWMLHGDNAVRFRNQK